MRRRLLVDRPVRQIVEAASRIARGDFSVRIPTDGLAGAEGFARIAESFNTLARELSGMETLRTDFIANVSHELKTPLTVLQNYGTLLQQPGLDEPTRQEYARAVTDTARRLASLVTNILRLNKLENQQIYPNAATYDLGEQLRECLLGFEDAWEQKGLCIETDVEDGVLVHTDAELLSLVWNNLFSNAIKFTDAGGTVGLALHARGPDAVVEVRDTGCGISPEVGRHIFEKFYQGDPSHATRGNGLGLALVRRVERQVTRKGTAAAVCVGVAGTLLLGLGMCCTTVWVELFAPGVGVGLAGIGLIAAALPLYNRITRREREKLAPLVLELTRDADPPAPPGAP